MTIMITKRNGRKESLDITKIQKMTAAATDGLLGVSQSDLELDAQIKFVDGMSSSDIQDALIKTAVEKIDIDVPNWTFVASRLFIYDLYHRVGKVTHGVKGDDYCHLADYLKYGKEAGRLLPALGEGFDLDDLTAYIKPERDLLFNYLGIKTLYDRYLIKNKNGDPIELPQQMFMAIAMFLAQNEENKQERAKEFYDVVSKFEVMLATPTLSNARTNRHQLSSCFLPGTEVQTVNGYQEIDKIELGTKVLTHDGSYKEVYELFERDFASSKFTLEIQGLNEDLVATEEHPILSLKWEDIACYRGGKKKKSQGLCIGNQGKKSICFTKKDCYSNECKDLYKENFRAPEFRAIKDLKVNDFVSIGFPTFEHDIKFIDIKSFIGIEDMVEDDGWLKIKNKPHDNKLSPRSVINNTINKVKNIINIDKNLMLIIGYFLAEGHISKDMNSICFTFGLKEKEYQNEVVEYFRTAFGIEACIQPNKDNSCNIIIQSKIIAYLFDKLCGSGFNKKYLNDILYFAPAELQKYILIGVIRGDGCSVTNGYQLALTNKKLINQLFQIALRNNFTPHMYNPFKGKLATEPAYTLIISKEDEEFCLAINKNISKINFDGKVSNYSRFWLDGKYYMKIKNSTSEFYSGKVYNIEVKDNHSYVVNNVDVHNCYIGSTPDNIEGIFDSYYEMALLSKYGGGIGWDWNQVRAMGGAIDGHKSAAGGTVPFLKIANDVALAVDQLGCVAKNSWVEVLDKVIITHENGRESIIEMIDNPSNSIREKTIKTFDIDKAIIYLLNTFGKPMKKYSEDQLIIAIRYYVTNGKRGNGRELIQEALDLTKDSTRNLSKAIGKWIEKCNFIPDGYKPIEYKDDLSNFICNEYGDIRCRKTLKPVIQEAGKLNHLNVTMNHKSYKSSRIIYFTWSDSKNYAANIDHKDNNKWNNHFNNLYEKTHFENISDGWEETGIEDRVNKGRIRKHLSLGYQLNGKNTIDNKNNLDPISIKEFVYKRIPISKVEKDMFAKSFNIETGKIEPKIIEAVYEMQVKKEDQISLNYKDGSYTITSAWHPTLVYKNDKFLYIRADEITVGDIGVDGLGNKVEYIESTKPNISEDYCDLTVKGNNNYFCVTDNKDGVSHVIHNTRKGAIAVYLEPWHMDINDFIDLKKNSGEERRRAHDLFPALWITDVFMERVVADEQWTLFDPYDVPELSELYGEEFRAKYLEFENNPEITKEKIKAKDLWKKILTSYFESGSPFLCFKDNANRANPNYHVGHIRSSNLCTEIFQNTNPNKYLIKLEYSDGSISTHEELELIKVDGGITKSANKITALDSIDGKRIFIVEKEKVDGDTAVCNLASINLSRINNREDIERITPVAVRMLDNVIDLNFYPLRKVKATNLKSRSIGLGVMGEAEMLATNQIVWGSKQHFNKINRVMEAISFNAIKASSELAVEKGVYPTFEGSKWSQGIMPQDHVKPEVEALTDSEPVYNWEYLREQVKKDGMRNGYLMAVAPTSSISILVGTTQAIEPVYKRKWFEENLSGLIPVVVPNLNPDTYQYYTPAFEIDQLDVIRAGAIRQKWIDQGQSLNIFMSLDKASGKYLNEIYTLGWKLGLKSTYYLRSQSPEAKNDVADRSIECSGCQ